MLLVCEGLYQEKNLRVEDLRFTPSPKRRIKITRFSGVILRASLAALTGTYSLQFVYLDTGIQRTGQERLQANTLDARNRLGLKRLFERALIVTQASDGTIVRHGLK